jgi:catechol 2,3-dioxygenase-like lactoylglutathione lyase family enzyme
MQIQSASPAFLVSDVAATARWYESALGFAVAGHFPNTEPYSYASIQLGGAEIMLLALGGYEKPDLSERRPEGIWDAYIRMSGVHELYRQCEGKAFVRAPIKKQTYGDWEFEARDPNGYVIVFGGDAQLEE